MKRSREEEEHAKRIADIKKFAANRKDDVLRETHDKLQQIEREMEYNLHGEQRLYEKIMIQGVSSIAQHVFLYTATTNNKTYFRKDVPIVYNRCFKMKEFDEDVWGCLNPLMEWCISYYTHRLNNIITLENEIDVSSIWEDMVVSEEHRTLASRVIIKYMSSRTCNKGEVVVHASVFYRLTAADGKIVRLPSKRSPSKRLVMPERIESLSDLMSSVTDIKSNFLNGCKRGLSRSVAAKSCKSHVISILDNYMIPITGRNVADLTHAIIQYTVGRPETRHKILDLLNVGIWSTI